MDEGNGSGDTFMAAVFEAGESLFGIDSARIEEIVRVPAITPVRGSSDYVLGIANLRGRIVTVLDVSARLGLGAAGIGEDARILVASSGGESIGILVRRLRDVMEVERSDLRALAGEVGAAREDLFLGVFDAQGRMTALLDPDKILEAG
jgi:purine-binding chemotaxis protein CheW